MTKIEATNVLKEFIETYIKSHGEEDVITVQLDNVDVEAFSTIVKELEQETVSKEVYNQLVFKAYKLDRILEQADLALGDIKVTLRSPNRDDMVDKIEKIVNKYDENVMEFFDFIEQKRDKSDENV